MEFINRLKDFDTQCVIVKHHDIEVGKIPLIFLVFFDIYDSIKEFDNILVFPNDLVDTKYIKLFIDNIKNIIEMKCDHFDIDGTANIIVICDFLQYNHKMFEELQENILKKYDVSSCDIIYIVSAIFYKLGRLYFSFTLCAIGINDDNLELHLNILKHTKHDHSKSTWLCHNLIKYYVRDKVCCDDLAEILCSKKCEYLGRIQFNKLSVKYQNDWNTSNIHSPIALLYSRNMQDIADYKKYTSDCIKFMSKSGDAHWIDISRGILKCPTCYEQHLAVCHLNNGTNCVYMPVYRCHSTSEYHIKIDPKYFTSEWFLVFTL